MRERFHILAGPTCNNNCVFCMEEDRLARQESYERITPQHVLAGLREHAAGGEVMFTSGEPTLNPNLGVYMRWARQLGYRTIGLTTNARRLGYEPYARELIREGLNLVVLSIHGPTARIHDGQTRTPGSFTQTLAGLETLARLKRERPFRIHSSTVVGQRNVRHFGDMLRLLQPRGVDELVFNVMQPIGRAGKLVDTLVARYADIVDEFRRFLAAAPAPRPAIYLVDLPLCTTEGLPAMTRGYVEMARFHEPDADGVVHLLETRTTKEEANRVKRAECGRCRYRDRCLGVWRAYVEQYGWEEFVPVTAAGGPSDVGARGPSDAGARG